MMTKRLYIRLDFQQVKTREEGTYDQLVVRKRQHPYISILRTMGEWKEKFPEFMADYVCDILDNGNPNKSADKFYEDLKARMKEFVTKLDGKDHGTMLIAYDPDWNGRRDFLYCNYMEREYGR